MSIILINTNNRPPGLEEVSGWLPLLIYERK